MPRDKYDSPNPRRTHTFMSAEDVAAGKKSTWTELEITGENIYRTYINNKNGVHKHIPTYDNVCTHVEHGGSFWHFKINFGSQKEIQRVRILVFCT